MRFWLMKTEPSAFGIDDLQRVGTEHWDGVRSYAARNNMQAMKMGDKVLIYHSMSNPLGVVGIAEVVREAYPDFTALDPKDKHFDPKSTPEKPIWYMVDVKFVQKFPRTVTVNEIKNTPELAGMSLLKIGRLSVHPVEQVEFELITKMARVS